VPPPPDQTAPVSSADLFLGFLGIGLSGFGGVMPWARRMVVERRRWLDAASFNDLLALCQFLPGPNVINLSVALGARFAGWRGALAAFSGLMLAPMAIVIALGALYARFGDLALVQHLFRGLAAGASGLIIATAAKIAWPLRRKPAAIAIAALVLFAAAWLRLPLVAVLVAGGGLGLLAGWRAR
jgi:chromate transporter